MMMMMRLPATRMITATMTMTMMRNMMLKTPRRKQQ